MNFINKYQKKDKLKLVLLLSVLFCFSLDLGRVLYTGNFLFVSLLWNLFLAFIPLMISSGMKKIKPTFAGKICAGILVFIWFLFFPNAPYIVTDLFHLQVHSHVPLWFDLLLIFSCAWTGLIAGFISLIDIEKHVYRFWKLKPGGWFILPIVILSMFGVYVGRYLRFNSWDFIMQPYTLVKETGRILLHPASNTGAWAFTIGFSILSLLIYYTIRHLPGRHV